MAEQILLVEDEVAFRDRFARALERAGHSCHCAGSVAEALAAVGERDYAVAFLDIRLPDGTGIELLETLADLCPQTAVIMMTAYAGLQSALGSLRLGAIDYLEKPFAFEAALHRLERTLEVRRLQQENRLLRRELPLAGPGHRLLGESGPMRELRKMIEQVAASSSNVLIRGESGTGKELAARDLHDSSPVAAGRFVAVNCASIPEELLESELFGHERGAFTGATQTKQGLFQLADGGTLFLDEIAEMSTALQAKLLRAVEQREFMRVGGTRLIPASFRLVAATHRDLEAEIASRRFREDLYYRIRVVELVMPPLRTRPSDIPLLARHFVERYRADLKRECLGVGNAAMRELLAYQWPGNVRELQNVIERAMILGTGPWIEPADLPADFGQQAQTAEPGLKEALSAYERELIRSVLEEAGNDRRRAAARLGIGLSSLYRKLNELDLDGD